jgi:hypothetical protein
MKSLYKSLLMILALTGTIIAKSQVTILIAIQVLQMILLDFNGMYRQCGIQTVHLHVFIRS